MRYTKGQQVRVFVKGKLVLVFKAKFSMCSTIAKKFAVETYHLDERYSLSEITIM